MPKLVKILVAFAVLANALAAEDSMSWLEKAEFEEMAASGATCAPSCSFSGGCSITDHGCHSPCASCTSGPAICECQTACAGTPPNCPAATGGAIETDNAMCDCGCTQHASHGIYSVRCTEAKRCLYQYPYNVTTGCATCVPGYYLSGSACAACAPGSYCSGGLADALPCPTGASSPLASSVISQCYCPPGWTGNNGTTCSECSASHYCPGATGNSVCPSGSTSPVGSMSIANCTCSPGYVGQNAAAACSECPVDHWCLGGSAASVACQNHTAAPAASPSASACICKAGYAGPKGGPCIVWSNSATKVLAAPSWLLLTSVVFALYY